MVFVVDVRDGVVPLDQEVARPAPRRQQAGRPRRQQGRHGEARAAGRRVLQARLRRAGARSAPTRSSARHELFDAIVAKLPPDTGEAPPGDAALKLAIVGRRNVGKSTFINSLAEAERVIVSEVPGTTRDSIDVRFERDGKAFVAIDTAGVRKKTTLASDVEFYSLHRAERSIRRADVVLHFFDARHRIGRVDKQLAEYILEEHKPAIFVVNKWDLVKDVDADGEDGRLHPGDVPDARPRAHRVHHREEGEERAAAAATRDPAAQAGRRAGRAPATSTAWSARRSRPTPPPMRSNRQPKIFYATQIGVHPPTIVLFTNGPELFDDTYVRYLTKALRDTFPFSEVAIKVVLRAKGEGSWSDSGRDRRGLAWSSRWKGPTRCRWCGRSPKRRRSRSRSGRS